MDKDQWWQALATIWTKLRTLQTSLERNSSNLAYISFLNMNFENLTVEFHVPYVLNSISNLVQIGCYLLFDQ